MKLRSSLFLALACGAVCLLPVAGRAQSTIDATLAYGWGANLGWTNWLPGATYGASIGEYICTGYVYSANVGWISLGGGAPANGIQYQNNAAGDWGVNFVPLSPGVAALRGYAYSANVGWINFEGTYGKPAVNLLNGQLYGYAYSANCGWINLGSLTDYAVKTDAIAPGVDTDGDGIADAWELLYFGNLTSASATSDSDGDGVGDLLKYLEGTDPRSIGGTLRITQVSAAGPAGGVAVNLTFTTTYTRLYKIETSPTLVSPVWSDSGLGVFAPDSGSTTTRQITGTGAAGFYRVRALRVGL